MKLISSREALNFLSKAAPRPWVQRLLRWMAFDEGLQVYSSKGKVQPHGMVMSMTVHLYGKAGEFSGPKMDALIREEYSQEIADLLTGRQPHDRFDDKPFVWGEDNEPLLLDIGFLLYASEIDWDAGTLTADFIPDDEQLRDVFFNNSEFLETELEKPDYDVLIEGLSFEFTKIEMLLPSMELGRTAGFTTIQHERRGPVGRPPKWDWEGAMAFVISEAQHPDGLPTGPGAQARIEKMISEWFLGEADEAPSPSQVRTRAAKIMRMIERPKTD